MRSVVPPLILATVQITLAMTFTCLRRLPFWTIILLGFLGLIGGGFSETFSFMYPFFLLLLLGNILEYGEPNRKRSWGLLLSACMAGTLTGLLIMAVAPGNQIRQAQLAQQNDLIEALRISIQAMGDYFSAIFIPGINILNLVLVLLTGFFPGSRTSAVAPKELQSNRDFSRALAIHLPLYMLILIYVCFILAALTISKAPPGRTDIIPTYLLVLGFCCWGFALGRLVARSSVKRSIASITPQVEQSIELGVSWIPRVVFSAWIVLLVLNSLLLSTNTLSNQADFRSFASDWDQQNAAIISAKTNHNKSFALKPVSNPLGLGSGNPGGWLNDCMNQYYGIDLDFIQ